MNYAVDSPLKDVVEKKWINTQVNDSLGAQTEALVKKFFHPESYEQYRISVEQESKGVHDDQ